MGLMHVARCSMKEADDHDHACLQASASASSRPIWSPVNCNGIYRETDQGWCNGLASLRQDMLASNAAVNAFNHVHATAAWSSRDIKGPFPTYFPAAESQDILFDTSRGISLRDGVSDPARVDVRGQEYETVSVPKPFEVASLTTTDGELTRRVQPAPEMLSRFMQE
jgi:hypothetical protein